MLQGEIAVKSDEGPADFHEVRASSSRSLAGGKSVEDVIRCCRDHDYSKISTICVLVAVQGVSLAEAKPWVHESPTWIDRRASDEDFHDTLRKLEG